MIQRLHNFLVFYCVACLPTLALSAMHAQRLSEFSKNLQHIFVSSALNKVLHKIDIDDATTVWDVKRKLYYKENIPMLHQELRVVGLMPGPCKSMSKPLPDDGLIKKLMIFYRADYFFITVLLDKVIVDP